ncbi:PfkB family carbohydrate kinase [Solirubrobacter deserti]|uniref:Ribokinase n=1 Tax=Solirubrobacter deserti TaxID=2282478 RepID=A0ABT4RL78_9ACTN|nr:PfkB family carbohydrate kinase [Solirubrobacter deserti]MDA0139319.1 PfkB family carbohydrate kinase [Solirubrobacter deserti]
MARVVVVGSINVDLVVVTERLPAAGETVTGGRFGSYGGGKSANQAVAAARLGAEVAFVGAVGDDAMGEEATEALRTEGIDVSRMARLGEPTGVALIVVDAAGENQIAVASGANAALDAAAIAPTLDELLAAADSPPAPTADSTPAPAGVVLLGHEVGEDVVIAAARAAEAAGWPVVLNPAPARELPAAPLAVLTPNASEAEQLTGEAEPEAAARALSESTGAAVLITLGARGALLLEPGGSPELLPATNVDVVDTTGAGDTVNGALAAELAAGRPLREAAEFALRAAALSTTKPGARGGMPTRAEVDAA